MFVHCAVVSLHRASYVCALYSGVIALSQLRLCIVQWCHCIEPVTFVHCTVVSLH